MKKYFYTGPNSAITLVVLDKEQQPTDVDVVLWRDTVVELPEAHEATQVLLHQGLLTAVIVEPVAVEAVVIEPKIKGKA